MRCWAMSAQGGSPIEICEWLSQDPHAADRLPRRARDVSRRVSSVEVWERRS